MSEKKGKAKPSEKQVKSELSELTKIRLRGSLAIGDRRYYEACAMEQALAWTFDRRLQSPLKYLGEADKDG